MSSENEQVKFFLWLDDIRDPATHIESYLEEKWFWAKTAQAAIMALRSGNVIFASLDHDLTDEQMIRGGYLGQIYEDGQKSGYDVVLWLEQHPEFWPTNGVQVHTANPAGRARMQQVIDKHYQNMVY